MRRPGWLVSISGLLAVIPGGPGALVRADTQVIWYPPRSRAEYVAPRRFAAVRLREHLLNPRPHTVRVTITSPAVIARLARTLDVLHAERLYVMRRVSQLARMTALAAGFAILALGGASCGTPPPGSPAASPPGISTARSRTLGPAPGTRRLAEAVARKLLASVLLPPGGRAVSRGGVPGQLRAAATVPGSKHLIQRYKIRTVNHPAGWILAFLRRHVPAGLITGATGDTGLIARPVFFLTWSQRHPQHGLYLAQLVVGVLAAGRSGRSFVRVDAQVIWYPPRSRAEYIRPARFKAVRLEATVLDRQVHVIRRVETSRTVIARLARSLNSLPADPGLTFACPSGNVTYRIAFVPKAAGQPPVLAVPSLCPPVGMTAGGRAQPDLLGGDAVLALVRRLLGPSVT